MKLAVTGKGGVGKTMLASLLSNVFARSGFSVLAIDADPNATLAIALGFPDSQRITPISEMADLIEERTGARPAEIRGLYFVGAGTHPGAGVPGVVASARATAGVILADHGIRSPSPA